MHLFIFLLDRCNGNNLRPLFMLQNGRRFSHSDPRHFIFTMVMHTAHYLNCNEQYVVVNN